MKKVTISLPEAVLEQLGERARGENKPLNQWLRELLSKEVGHEDGWAHSFEALANGLARNEGALTWNREEIYSERLR